MKNALIIIAAFAGLFVGKSMAQTPDGSVNKEKLKVFSAWIGRWQGESSMQMGPGEPKRSTVDEHIESKLEGTLLLVEGVGKAVDTRNNQEFVAHHALGVVSYNTQTNAYNFKTYLKDGRSTDAWLNVMGENNFQWGFDVPNYGKMRYTITLTKNTWNEIGEFSQDGTTYRKFFEMNLKKTE